MRFSSCADYFTAPVAPSNAFGVTCGVNTNDWLFFQAGDPLGLSFGGKGVGGWGGGG